MKNNQQLLAVAIASLLSLPALATNGMNMEGYGPVSTAMGGTAQAYNNGLGGMMNNPATMGWQCASECQKFSIGAGFLQPDVKTNVSGMGSSTSDGTRYSMPNLGYAQKKNGLTWGIGIMSQGGMGTEYKANSIVGSAFGGTQRSELSVGRVIVPLAYEVNKDLQIGGSIDYVWAGLDMKMTNPSSGAYVSASNNNDYTGRMTGSGWGAKLGIVYRLNKQIDIGASYHTKTNISNLSGSGTLTFGPGGYDGAGTGAGTTMNAKYQVIDFQWPETMGVGIAYRPSNDWLFAFDIKKIMWSNTMKNFRMAVNGTEGSPMSMNWDDQTVIMLGGAYQATPNLTLRAGVNHAANPIPNNTINPLFPAIVERHYTFGLGYKISKNHSVDTSLTLAPEEKQTATNGMYNVSHGQTNVQVLYTYEF